MKTPVTAQGLALYDHLPPAEAASKAWSVPGRNPDWHWRARQEVADAMPLLARALDRLGGEAYARQVAVDTLDELLGARGTQFEEAAWALAARRLAALHAGSPS